MPTLSGARNLSHKKEDSANYATILELITWHFPGRGERNVPLDVVCAPVFIPFIQPDRSAWIQRSGTIRSTGNWVYEFSTFTIPSGHPAEVPPSGAVITLKGLCPGSTGPATGTDCKTIITREQFEKLVGTLNPDMPKNSHQLLAEQYSKALILQIWRSGRNSRDTALQRHDGLHAHASSGV